MDFNLKKWREEQHQQESEEEQPSAKIPRQYHQQQEATVLPLFASSEHQQHPDHSSIPTAIPTSSPRFPREREGYKLSIGQWQELELQAVIYRHMIAGVAVPPELLQLVKKSLFTSSSSSSASPYYLHLYSPHFHQVALLQGGGYWGKGAMDPEPGRCRRTDGKKWRCSRDIVAGHKYCERHVHRGRNRSRKPVEFPSTVGSLNKSSCVRSSGGGGGGGGTPFSLSGIGSAGVSSHDAFHLNQGRSSELSQNEQHSIGGGEKSSNNRVLMRFLDDWPRSLQQSDNAKSNSGGGGGNPSSMSLSMSTTPGNRTSDFLKLSTGNIDEVGPRLGNGNEERERGNWWGGNQVGMGGPLGEALRSSTNSNSSSHSPTSVLLLHQLPHCSASDTSYVTA